MAARIREAPISSALQAEPREHLVFASGEERHHAAARRRRLMGFASISPSTTTVVSAPNTISHAAPPPRLCTLATASRFTQSLGMLTGERGLSSTGSCADGERDAGAGEESRLRRGDWEARMSILNKMPYPAPDCRIGSRMKDLARKLFVATGSRIKLGKISMPADTLGVDEGRRLRSAAARIWSGCPYCSTCYTPKGVEPCWWCCKASTPAGKDGTIRHVMSGLNPQGVRRHVLQGAGGRGEAARLSVAHP